MSLDWNLANIEDWENVCKTDDGTLSPVTNALIMVTMGIDMPEITEANVEEFAWRVSFYELLAGPLLVKVEDDDFVPDLITIEQVRQHIGLRTNVSPRTTNQFVKKMVDIHRQDFDREAARQREGV